MSTQRAIRVAWIAAGSVLAIGSIGMGTAQAVSGLAHERHTFRRSFEAVPVLDVELHDGSLTVERSAGAGIELVGHLSEGLRSPDHSERVVGDRLVVRSRCDTFLSTWCSLDYTLRVPAGTDVVARVQDGSVRIAGVDGAVDARSSDGGVDVDGARGSFVAHSSDGSIRATGLDVTDATTSSSDGGIHLVFRSAPRSVSADSSDGSITLELPDTDHAYAVDAGASDGSVDTPVRQDPRSARRIRAHSSDGDVTVRYGGRP
jgi:hypothetical protein